MSKTYFVSRHPGAVTWAMQRGLNIDTFIPHLDITCIQRGDTVIGTLPIELAASVQSIGARYRHLSLNMPAHRRGHELSADDLEALGARLLDFDIRPTPNNPEGLMPS